jgi:tripartite-type tricarboxylate transporter receptor subunit TctC
MHGLGLTPVTLPPAETAAFVASERARWRKVIDDAGIKAE